jgi:CheY-like chemotaxis protein
MVEDDQTLRQVISLRLRKFGYQVLEACNGPEALTQWETISQQVDIVLTDMVMPGGISGLDLVENLRKTKPTLKAIVSSGYSSILTHSDTPGKNGVVFLPKPYDSAALAKTVRDYLDRR